VLVVPIKLNCVDLAALEFVDVKRGEIFGEVEKCDNFYVIVVESSLFDSYFTIYSICSGVTTSGLNLEEKVKCPCKYYGSEHSSSSKSLKSEESSPSSRMLANNLVNQS